MIKLGLRLILRARIVCLRIAVKHVSLNFKVMVLNLMIIGEDLN